MKMTKEEFITKTKAALSDLKWLFPFAKRHIWAIALYTLLGMTGTVVGLVSGLVSKDMVDIVTGHKTGELITTFLTMIGIQVIIISINSISGYFNTLITTKVDLSVKAETYDKILSSDWEALAQFHSGDIMSRWQGDSSSIASGMLSIVPSVVTNLFRFVSSLLLIVRYDASFAVFSLISVPISYATSRISMRKMREAGMDSMKVNSELNALSQDSFSDIQNVKALDLLKLYKARLREIQKKSLDAKMKYQKQVVINSIILILVSQTITYATYGWGVYRVWSGVITYGTMTMFLGMSSSLSSTAQSLFNVVPSTITLLNATKRLRSIVDLPKEDYSMGEEALNFIEMNRDEGIGIALNNVSFNYKDKDNVFADSYMVARPHEIVGLIGPSGGGKTTTLRMILAIINSRTGYSNIFSVKNESNTMPITASTRQLMAYVPQGSSMFAGTIAENMRNVKVDASDDEIIEALKLAEAWEFVSKLPEGINTKLGERGAGFSEGQSQRLSIARALLRKSPILLLDEATSALDVKTANKVLSNITDDTYPRTCILTTHKPEVMKLCDRIYIIDECRIAEGSYEDVI
ncbi:MAG: ABC transporter ATP-binding protein/permease [Lachnospiraceae bacterium]|nr:ABC transporter ATP-binding protein/permease [Lachnospiraceae bacterium]